MKTRWMATVAAMVIGISNGPARAQDGGAVSLEWKIARFAPTTLAPDLKGLSEGDRKALEKLIAAARLMDEIFLRQVWSGNVAMRDKLAADTSPSGASILHYFRINVGPWSRIDDNEPWLPGVGPKPPGANHYPEDITKEEFEAWSTSLPAEEKAKATGFFHAIRRDDAKKLVAIPYSKHFAEFLEPAAQLLEEAAQLTDNESLRKYLVARAAAFRSDDYYASDVAWMELDAPIDVTIGPYETYEDKLFGYKAAFEAYVTLRDEAETGKLAKFSGYLQELENNLPMDPKYRNPKIGALSPIRAVQVVFSAGEARRGVMTAAFNLPNDERVTKEKGSKRVMLRNIQEAKFEKVLIPISKTLLPPALHGDVAFDPFFTHILMHELIHGIGPHDIQVGGEATTVRKSLRDLYSSIEEAKADVTGLWALQYLVDKGAIDKEMEKTMYTTFLASMFRSLRFGIAAAHGRGMAIQFNSYVDDGAIVLDEKTGTWSIDLSKIHKAVEDLARELLTVEAEGSYEKAKALIDERAVMRPALKASLDRLGTIPVDIEPLYTHAK